MKIAHVTLYPPKGKKHVSSSGVASYSKNLVQHIPAKEQTVISHILTQPETYSEGNITVHRSFYRSPKFLSAVHRALKRTSPDVVHIQQELSLFGGFSTAFLLQWLVVMWRKKTVITLHGVVDPTAITTSFVKENNSRLPVWIVRTAFYVIYWPLMRHASHIIVHEQHFKDIIEDKYGISGNKVAVIPHGVEPLQITNQEAARAKLGLPKNCRLVLFMGYATGYKGIDLLIDGFSRFAASDPKAFLVIGAGEHPKLRDDPTYKKEYARLKQKAAACLPKNQYAWRGFIEEADIADYYSACDTSLFPYTTAMSSSGPMALSIGYEKPFLVSSAFSSIFKQYPSLLFERTPDSLAARLAYFFEHQEEYADISKTIKQDRTWQSVGEQSFAIYQKVTKGESHD